MINLIYCDCFVLGIANAMADPSAEATKKKKLKLSYEEYRNMSNLLIMHLHREELKIEIEETESRGGESAGKDNTLIFIHCLIINKRLLLIKLLINKKVRFSFF